MGVADLIAGQNNDVPVESGENAAGDLRDLFRRQLSELLVHGFDFFFRGVKFFF